MLHCLLPAGDVAVAEDGDMDAGVGLDGAYHRPVGRAAIHLALGAAVDGQGGNAGVLERLGEVDDRHGLRAVGQAGLDGDGERGATHHGGGDFQHLGNILQDAAAGTAARHLAHGASPVDVHKVGLGTLHHLEAAQQLLLVGAENLYADGTLSVREAHLAQALLGIAVQGLGGDELGHQPVGAHLLAELAERHIGHIVHRRETYHTVFYGQFQFHIQMQRYYFFGNMCIFAAKTASHGQIATH